MKMMKLHGGFFSLREGGDYADWLYVRQKPQLG